MALLFSSFWLKLITFAFNPSFPWGLVSFTFSAICSRPMQEVCSGGVQGLGLSLDIDEFWTVLSVPYLFSNCPSGGWASLHRRNPHFEYVHYFCGLVSEEQSPGCLFACVFCSNGYNLQLFRTPISQVIFITADFQREGVVICTLVLHRFPEFVASLLHIFPAVVSYFMYHIDF